MSWSLAPGTTRFILVRHGEPEPAARGRCYGRLDVELSPRGAAQARSIATWLEMATIAAVYSSPSRRAIETAEPIASCRGLCVQVRDALQEIDFGALEGLTYDEAAVRYPDNYGAWMIDPTGVTFPGGESYADLRERVLGAATELRHAHGGEAVALVAHGGVLRALLADALRMAHRDIFRIDVAYGSVSIIDYVEGLAHVRLMNASSGESRCSKGG